MKKFAIVGVILLCASCSDETGVPADRRESTSGKAQQSCAGETADPTKKADNKARELSEFWTKVRDASAARTDAPKQKLKHIVNTEDGPVVVEVEVVIEEYLRILEEERQQVQKEPQKEEPEVQTWNFRTREDEILQREKQERLERNIEASQVRRRGLEAELQVERERGNRQWVIEQLEKDIAEERADEAISRLELDRLDDGQRIRVMMGPGRRADNGCAPMPFGGSSFGPWDTGQGTYRP